MVQNYSGSVSEETIRFVGEHHPIQRGITLKSTGSDVELKAGTVLAMITAESKYVVLNPAASDGSENAKRILSETMFVAAAGDEPSVVYVHGEFYDSGLTWPDGISAADKQTAIDALNIQGVYVV